MIWDLYLGLLDKANTLIHSAEAKHCTQMCLLNTKSNRPFEILKSTEKCKIKGFWPSLK